MNPQGFKRAHDFEGTPAYKSERHFSSEQLPHLFWHCSLQDGEAPANN